ncbi:hypothetical protein CFter6_0373 [Collimonas fungivorans]|uniref:Uncharacterized protein n=1 Tax=Collimonas fungivorans TaxID=158899 RepID=A0A127P5Z5_9BURK|nr:hypothetical protein CFter6_0373 [Collimonas fungivorans]
MSSCQRDPVKYLARYGQIERHHAMKRDDGNSMGALLFNGHA